MRVFVVALAVVAGCKSKETAPAGKPQESSPAPTLRLPDDAAPVAYRASLEVDPTSDKFEGRIEIDVTVKRAVSTLWLTADQLTIEKAVLRRDGKETPLVVRPQPRNFVALDLGRAVPACDATLIIDYTGVQHAGNALGMARYFDAGDHYVVTQFEPQGARRVFPGFDEPSFKVPWTIDLTVPSGDNAFTNAGVDRQETLPDGRKRSWFKPTRPLPSYLIAIAVGPFDTVDAGTSRTGVAMRIVVPRGRGGDAKSAAIESGKVLAMQEDYTGIPYPYDKLDHVAVPGTQRGAMEHPGLITYGPRYLLIPDGESVTAYRGQAGIFAHELAHQWFGNLVTNAWWDDLWLNEAFATWLTPKTIEIVHPEMDGAIDPVISRGGALAADALSTARRIRQPITSEADMSAAFDGITYAKGATVIRMFETWLGPDVFRDGVRAYLGKFADRAVTAADFLGVLGGATDKPIAAAFTSYLDQAGVPQIDMTLRCDAGKPPVVELAQRRFLSKTAKVDGTVVWHVPVCVEAAGAKQCTLLDEPSGELVLGEAASKCPAWINPNADGVGYYVSNLPADLVGRLLDDGWKHLSRQERIAFLGDQVMLIDGGHADVATILPLLPKLGRSGDPYLAEIAIGRLERLSRMVADDQRPAFARLVRDTVGKLGAKLGWLPRHGEPLGEAKLRGRVMTLLAVEGADARARDRALALARGWVADPTSLPESMWAAVVVAAIRAEPAAIFELLAGKLPAVTDRVQQRLYYAALAHVPDVALLERALAMLDGGDTIAVEKNGLLRVFPETVALQSARFDHIRDHKDDLLKRLPRDYQKSVLAWICDASRRDDVAAYLKSLTSYPDIGDIPVIHDSEQMDLCIARRAAQAPSLARFLAGR